MGGQLGHGHGDGCSGVSRLIARPMYMAEPSGRLAQPGTFNTSQRRACWMALSHVGLVRAPAPLRSNPALRALPPLAPQGSQGYLLALWVAEVCISNWERGSPTSAVPEWPGHWGFLGPLWLLPSVSDRLPAPPGPPECLWGRCRGPASRQHWTLSLGLWRPERVPPNTDRPDLWQRPSCRRGGG